MGAIQGPSCMERRLQTEVHRGGGLGYSTGCCAGGRWAQQQAEVKRTTNCGCPLMGRGMLLYKAVPCPPLPSDPGWPVCSRDRLPEDTCVLEGHTRAKPPHSLGRGEA